MTKDQILEAIDEFVSENIEDLQTLDSLLEGLEDVCHRLDDTINDIDSDDGGDDE